MLESGATDALRGAAALAVPEDGDESVDVELGLAVSLRVRSAEDVCDES